MSWAERIRGSSPVIGTGGTPNGSGNGSATRSPIMGPQSGFSQVTGSGFGVSGKRALGEKIDSIAYHGEGSSRDNSAGGQAIDGHFSSIGTANSRNRQSPAIAHRKNGCSPVHQDVNAMAEYTAMLAEASQDHNISVVRILRLPAHIWELILTYISYLDVVAVTSTCKGLRVLYQSEAVWTAQFEFFKQDMRDLRGGRLLRTERALEQLMQVKAASSASKESGCVPHRTDDSASASSLSLSSIERLKKERTMYAKDTVRDWALRERQDIGAANEREGILMRQLVDSDNTNRNRLSSLKIYSISRPYRSQRNLKCELCQSKATNTGCGNSSQALEFDSPNMYGAPPLPSLEFAFAKKGKDLPRGVVVNSSNAAPNGNALPQHSPPPPPPREATTPIHGPVSPASSPTLPYVIALPLHQALNVVSVSTANRSSRRGGSRRSRGGRSRQISPIIAPMPNPSSYSPDLDSMVREAFILDANREDPPPSSTPEKYPATFTCPRCRKPLTPAELLTINDHLLTGQISASRYTLADTTSCENPSDLLAWMNALSSSSTGESILSTFGPNGCLVEVTENEARNMCDTLMAPDMEYINTHLVGKPEINNSTNPNRQMPYANPVRALFRPVRPNDYSTTSTSAASPSQRRPHRWLSITSVIDTFAVFTSTPFQTRFFVAPKLTRNGRVGIVVLDAIRLLVIVKPEATDDVSEYSR